VISLNAAPAVDADTIPGWLLFASSTEIFTGDAINVTAVGPRVASWIEFDLYEPDGRLNASAFKRLDNGTNRSVWVLDLEAPRGAWRVDVLVGETLIGSVYIDVRFDEVDYLLKVNQILIQRLDNVSARQDIQGRGISTLYDRTDYLWAHLLVIGLGLATVGITWYYATIPGSSWMFKVKADPWAFPGGRLRRLQRRIAGNLSRYDHRLYDEDRAFDSGPTKRALDLEPQNIVRRGGGDAK
jgi:hypothetical protein